MSITSLMPAYLQSLEPYESPSENAPEGMIWLNTNEYPTATKYELRFETLNRYPEVQPLAFRKRYAKYAGVNAEEVLMTRGADEAIELLIRTFCAPLSDAVLYALPTYSMYGISAKTCGVDIQTVAPARDLKLNIDGLCRALRSEDRVKVVFLCNPNNPTGELLSRTSILKVLQAARDTIVVVDEAYIEFCPQASCADLIAQYPNLVIVRTLSKAFALAGLRCGVILAQKEVIGALRKVLAPYPVPEPVGAIALKALSDGGVAAMRQRVQLVIQTRRLLQTELQKLAGVRTVYPSETNFVLFSVDNPEAVYQTLWKKGVAIREPGSDKGVLRVSVGTIEECQTFIEKLRQVLKEVK